MQGIGSFNERRQHHPSAQIETARSAFSKAKWKGDVQRMQGGGTERVGFEPTVQLPVLRFSRPAHSTTLAPLQLTNCMNSVGERSSLLDAGDPAGRLNKEARAEAELGFAERPSARC